MAKLEGTCGCFTILCANTAFSGRENVSERTDHAEIWSRYLSFLRITQWYTPSDRTDNFVCRQCHHYFPFSFLWESAITNVLIRRHGPHTLSMTAGRGFLEIWEMWRWSCAIRNSGVCDLQVEECKLPIQVLFITLIKENEQHDAVKASFSESVLPPKCTKPLLQ